MYIGFLWRFCMGAQGAFKTAKNGCFRPGQSDRAKRRPFRGDLVLWLGGRRHRVLPAHRDVGEGLGDIPQPRRAAGHLRRLAIGGRVIQTPLSILHS